MKRKRVVKILLAEYEARLELAHFDRHRGLAHMSHVEALHMGAAIALGQAVDLLERKGRP